MAQQELLPDFKRTQVQIEAQERYEQIMETLYPVNTFDLGIARLREPRGRWACNLLETLDTLDQKRIPETVVEDWDESEFLQKLVEEINALYRLGRYPLCTKREATSRLYRKRF